jgi:hypothetical protein
MVVVTLGWWPVGPWYEYGGGPTATRKFTLELITNVASDSSVINNGQP